MPASADSERGVVGRGARPGRWLRALVALLLCAPMATLAAPTAAAAAIGWVLPLWITNCGDCIAVVPRDGQPLRVPIGLRTSGKTRDAKLTVDFSRLSAGSVEVIGMSRPCTGSGAVITCAFGTVGTGTFMAYVVLQAHPGAAGGAGGTVRVTSHTSTAGMMTFTETGKVKVSYDATSTDISIRTSAASVRVGDIASVAVIVRNNGPSLQPFVELFDLRPQHHTTYVDSDGCAGSGDSFQCRTEQLGVGRSVTFTLRFRVTGCDSRDAPGGSLGAYLMAYQDALGYNDDLSFAIKVVGCSDTPPPESGGSQPRRPAPTTTTLSPPTPSPTVPQSASPTAVSLAVTSARPHSSYVAIALPESSRAGLTRPVAAIIVLAVTGLVAAFLRLRQRRRFGRASGASGSAPEDVIP